jgi:carboxyl-terminal processing protease
VVGVDAKRKSTNMKKINKITLALLLIFSSLIGNNYLYSKNSNELYEKIDLFSEVLDTIKKNYVDEVDQSVVMDSAINGVLQSLDPYSAYMSPKSFEGMQTETKGEFGGLGIEIGMESGVVKVITPINDTPASDAGIKSGDYIVKINEEQVQGKSLSEAVELMRGPVGSKINLTVRRKNVKKALNFTIKRAVIEVKSVEAKIVGEEKKIGYLRLKSFNENSYNQLSKSINKFEKNNKLNGYILDLRNNPGGLLTQAINITDFFLNDGEIVSTKGRKVSETRRFFSKKGDGINGKPLILITNNGSASASEIVAGALKDHKRAIILGENTYGKGSVQSIIPLKNGGGIRLTISKYYLPSGKSISEIGVLPDIFVEEIEDNFKINSKTDNQLAYAINLLKS